jgi:hypothetical protein
LWAVCALSLFACGGSDTPDRVDPAYAPAAPPLFPVGDSGSPPVTSDSGCHPDPGNYDIPGNGCDDDGDGTVDNVPRCDDGALPVNGDAAQFASALSLCQTSTGPTDPRWGIVSATYTTGGPGTVAPPEAQHGILGRFGLVVEPREGASLGVLSSGFAREYDSLNGLDAFKGLKTPMQDGTPNHAPPGYPRTVQGCPTLDNAVYDLAELTLAIKVPNNALGLAFDFNFWSGEWPEYVCTPYNDTFIAYLSSKGFNGGKPENVSLDANHNTVSVNNGFFDRCTPGTVTGCADGVMRTAGCPSGEAELAGTGFDDRGTYCTHPSTGGGATGWLTSQAPVLPGEILTLELMVWDTGDPNWDSSVLLDNFRWLDSPVVTSTGRPQ